MHINQHANLLVYSALTWLVFYLLGLPDYYQRLSISVKGLLVVAVTLIYFPVTKYTLRKFWNDGKHLKNAFRLAFYLTLPFFTYDYLLLGLYKGLGIKFVIPYWYLTFFYFSFWLQFPFIAFKMERENNTITDEEIQ